MGHNFEDSINEKVYDKNVIRCAFDVRNVALILKGKKFSVNSHKTPLNILFKQIPSIKLFPTDIFITSFAFESTIDMQKKYQFLLI